MSDGCDFDTAFREVNAVRRQAIDDRAEGLTEFSFGNMFEAQERAARRRASPRSDFLQYGIGSDVPGSGVFIGSFRMTVILNKLLTITIQ